MKHAYLIMAHNNWWQLRRLIQLLDDPNHDIYVHIDKKSKDFKQSDFDGVTKKSKIKFYHEYKVYWGGYSQVQTEIFLLREAYQSGYDYYHLLSGADLPLKSNEEIQLFFADHRGMEFIHYDNRKTDEDLEIKRRTRLYHFLQNYRRRYKVILINKFFTFCERVSMVIQILLGVNRVKDLDWEIKYGSQWVSISNDLVRELLHQSEKIEKVFSCTNCSDELFIQTVAYNCGFRDKIYKNSQGNFDNLRLVDWERGSNGNPYTFRKEDLAMLRKSDALFARKFSETIDREIIEELCYLR